MIAHKNIIEQRSQCIYYPNINCILNLNCTSCPIGCQAANLNKPVVFDIEDISSMKAIIFSTKIKNSKNIKNKNKKKKSKLDCTTNNDSLFLEFKKPLIDSNDQVINDNDNNILLTTKNILLKDNKVNNFKNINNNKPILNDTDNNIDNDLFTANNLIIKDLKNNLYTLDLSNNHSIKLSCFINGKLVMIKCKDISCALSKALLILFGDIFIKLFSYNFKII
ncbi:hypothetical protein IOLA_157 [uncultured bacterium]|nr:hypothetical protein IOLA_157 [uncultured bacterium]